jgi:hypothetical protein
VNRQRRRRFCQRRMNRWRALPAPRAKHTKCRRVPATSGSDGIRHWCTRRQLQGRCKLSAWDRRRQYYAAAHVWNQCVIVSDHATVRPGQPFKEHVAGDKLFACDEILRRIVLAICQADRVANRDTDADSEPPSQGFDVRQILRPLTITYEQLAKEPMMSHNTVWDQSELR